MVSRFDKENVVYVVLASTCDYEPPYWIAGAFDAKADAFRAVAQAEEEINKRRAAYDEWWDRAKAMLPPNIGGAPEELRSAILLSLGDEPPYRERLIFEVIRTVKSEPLAMSHTDRWPEIEEGEIDP